MLRGKLDYINPTTLHKIPESDRIVIVKKKIEDFVPQNSEIKEGRSTIRDSQFAGSGGKRMFLRNFTIVASSFE